MTGEEKVWVAEGSLGLVRAVRATYFFARITAFFTGDAVGCQKTVMLFSRRRRGRGRRRRHLGAWGGGGGGAAGECGAVEGRVGGGSVRTTCSDPAEPRSVRVFQPELASLKISSWFQDIVGWPAV